MEAEGKPQPTRLYPPYSFRQDEDSVNVTFQVPKGPAKSDLNIKINNNKEN